MTASAEFETIRRSLRDRYQLEREIGRGGMGAVYLARDLRLDRHVALKVLLGELATQVAFRDRFLRETRTAASFSHPNIVPVYAVEEHESLIAFAMSFVEGETLAERVQRTGPLPVREIVRVLQDVGYALAYAHGRSVVHRDIKPDNIMIERATGRALVMDFGISRIIDAPVAGAVGLTRVGEVVGTPEYMSPEQASGDVLDGRSDLYSLGLVALFAASGRSLMSGETTQKILVRQLTESLPPAAALRPDLPPALASAIDRCTAKDPVERFANAESLVEAIDAAQLGEREIPLAIRLFTTEIATVSMIVVGVTLFLTALTSRLMTRDMSQVDTLLPIVLFAGVLVTRALTTVAELRRIVAEGFTTNDVLEGMRRVLGEGARRRAELGANPRVVQRRRQTVRWAFALLALAIGFVTIAWYSRVPLGPGRWDTPLWGRTLVFSGLALLGTGFVLLVRSPFRALPSARLFRAVWLGPIGRFALGVAAGGAGGATGSAPVRKSDERVVTSAGAPLRFPPPDARPTRAPADDRLALLERRVTALEAQRASQP